MKKTIFLSFALLLITAQVSNAVERHVPSEYDTIQEAIDDCVDGDTVIVAPGTYTGSGNRDIDFLGKAITVRSTDPNDPSIVASTIIDCNATEEEHHRGFYFHNGEDANCVLSGFTITNGYAWYGGGIFCDYSSPIITNCTISGNSAQYYGGGIHCWDSSPTITSCTFSGNAVHEGGAGGGGGVCNYDESSPTINNCTFSRNSAFGGMTCGGGMYNIHSSPTVTNCTFSGNSADAAGGGMYNGYSSSPTVTNCTFSGNSANSGGGMYNYISNPTVTNCVLWGNTPEEIYVSSGNLVVTYSGVQGSWPGEGNIDADPCFIDPCNGDYHLLAGSPCIDAGDNTAVPADTADLDGDGNTTEPIPFDLDGNPRIVDGNDDGIAVVDMGAFEAMVSCFGVNHVKLEAKADKKGNEVELKGTFAPASPINFAVDDVAYIIDDGQGNAMAFLIPAGSFEPEGEPGKQKFKFHSAKGSQPDIKAKFDFDKCKFELKVKGVMNTSEITAETLAIELWAGANLVEEVVQVQVKPKHTEYKRKPKLSCCPKCKGIVFDGGNQ